MGLHENGSLYAYVPESGSLTDAITALAEEMIKPQALGGSVLSGAFWAFNPWWLAGILGVAAIAGIAAAAGGSSGGGSSAPAVANTPTVETPTDGSAVIVPGANNTTLSVSYIDENGVPQTLNIARQADGTWAAVDANNNVIAASALPAGVTINATTGAVTLAPNSVQDLSTVKAVGVETGKVNSPEASGNTAQLDGVADAPEVVANADGGASVTPGADNDKVTITYVDEKGVTQSIVVVKDPTTGKWASTEPTAVGVTVDPNTGAVTFDPNSVKDVSLIKAVGEDTTTPTKQTSEGNDTTPAQDTVADIPDVVADEKGGATVTPGDDNDAVVITYYPEGATEPQSFTVTKGANGWELPADAPARAEIDPETGVVKLDPNSLAEDKPVTAVGKATGKTDSEKDTDTTPTEDKVADIPDVVAQDDGSVTVAPGKDNDAMIVTYTPEGKDTTPQSFTVTKGADGWKLPADAPAGAKIDPTTGEVTLDPNTVKDGEPVTAVGQSSGKDDSTADKDTAKDDTVADIPDVVADEKGGATVTPGADNDAVVITYYPEGLDQPQSFTVTKGANGWELPTDAPAGTKIDSEGVVTFDPNSLAEDKPVTAVGQATGKTDSAEDTDTTPTEDKVADIPDVVAQDDGSVTVAPGKDNDAMIVTYTPEGKDTTPQSFTVTKGADGWKLPADAPAGAKIDPTTGEVTLDPNTVKDGEPVTAVGQSAGKDNSAADEDTAKDDKVADIPDVVADGKGGASVAPGADNDAMIVTYTPEGKDTTPQSFTVTKGASGWELPADAPAGTEIDSKTGVVTLDPDALKDRSTVTAVGQATGKTDSETDQDTVKDDVVADQPTVTPNEYGEATVSPGYDNTKLTITFTPEASDGVNAEGVFETTPAAETTIVLVKDPDTGKWSVTEGELPEGELPERVTVNADTGEVSFGMNALTEGTTITAVGEDTTASSKLSSSNAAKAQDDDTDRDSIKDSVEYPAIEVARKIIQEAVDAREAYDKALAEAEKDDAENNQYSTIYPAEATKLAELRTTLSEKITAARKAVESLADEIIERIPTDFDSKTLDDLKQMIPQEALARLSNDVDNDGITDENEEAFIRQLDAAKASLSQAIATYNSALAAAEEDGVQASERANLDGYAEQVAARKSELDALVAQYEEKLGEQGAYPDVTAPKSNYIIDPDLQPYAVVPEIRRTSQDGTSTSVKAAHSNNGAAVVTLDKSNALTMEVTYFNEAGEKKVLYFTRDVAEETVKFEGPTGMTSSIEQKTWTLDESKSDPIEQYWDQKDEVMKPLVYLGGGNIVTFTANSTLDFSKISVVTTNSKLLGEETGKVATSKTVEYEFGTDWTTAGSVYFDTLSNDMYYRAIPINEYWEGREGTANGNLVYFSSKPIVEVTYTTYDGAETTMYLTRQYGVRTQIVQIEKDENGTWQYVGDLPHIDKATEADVVSWEGNNLYLRKDVVDNFKLSISTGMNEKDRLFPETYEVAEGETITLAGSMETQTGDESYQLLKEGGTSYYFSLAEGATSATLDLGADGAESLGKWVMMTGTEVNGYTGYIYVQTAMASVHETNYQDHVIFVQNGIDVI